MYYVTTYILSQLDSYQLVKQRIIADYYGYTITMMKVHMYVNVLLLVTSQQQSLFTQCQIVFVTIAIDLLQLNLISYSRFQMTKINLLLYYTCNKHKIWQAYSILRLANTSDCCYSTLAMVTAMDIKGRGHGKIYFEFIL